ncbi:MAG: L-lactate dehydrogenase [Patescibacteria group bacterium]
MIKKISKPHSKIAVIGAGAVGSTIAYTAAIKSLAAEVILIDLDEAKEGGQAMDIADGLCFLETSRIKGADFEDASNADIIIITAGAAQKEGETRLDLAEKNKKILKSIFSGIGKIKNTAVVIIVSNPVDVLTHLAQEIAGLPYGQVLGSGTALDTARLKTELGHHFSVSPHNVHGFVLGEHGDGEFVAWSSVSIAGRRVDQLKGFDKKIAKEVERKIRREAYEIISRKGATYFGIAQVVSYIIEAILFDQRMIFPVSARLTNWNGISGVCLGAPAVIGQCGVESLWPLQLTSQEKIKFRKTADTIRQYL